MADERTTLALTLADGDVQRIIQDTIKAQIAVAVLVSVLDRGYGLHVTVGLSAEKDRG